MRPVDVETGTLPGLVCNPKHCYLSLENKTIIIIIIYYILGLFIYCAVQTLPSLDRITFNEI